MEDSDVWGGSNEEVRVRYATIVSLLTTPLYWFPKTPSIDKHMVDFTTEQNSERTHPSNGSPYHIVAQPCPTRDACPGKSRRRQAVRILARPLVESVEGR